MLLAMIIGHFGYDNKYLQSRFLFLAKMDKEFIFKEINGE
ncbi:hypothetical protein PALB_32870 [Pseudoalteromonas luteoviolacea B = ATCC 29581]|nr:hypothetical protein PALB_32870 [Pseudoalteromonas luteoviolacea B = ATCC 29581]